MKVYFMKDSKKIIFESLKVSKLNNSVGSAETFTEIASNNLVNEGDGKLSMKNQWPPTSKPVIESVLWRFQKTCKVPVKEPVDIYT